MREDKKIPKKSPKLSPAIRKLITIESLKYPRIPREALAIDLEERIGQLDIAKPPTRETLKKLISGMRASEKPEPIFFSVGMVPTMSAEGVAKVFEVQQLLRDHYGQWEKGQLILPIAEWIGRLYALIPDVKALYVTAGVYALYQLVDVLAKGDQAEHSLTDTSELDALVAKRDFATLQAKFHELNNVLPGIADGSDLDVQNKAQEYIIRQNGGAK